MTHKATYPGIEERVRHHEGATLRTHVVSCSCKSCQNESEIVIAGKRKPPAVIHNILKRRGWTVRAKRSEFTCPAH